MLKKIDEKQNSINDISIINDCINVLNSSKESSVYDLFIAAVRSRLRSVPISRILFLIHALCLCLYPGVFIGRTHLGLVVIFMHQYYLYVVRLSIHTGTSRPLVLYWSTKCMHLRTVCMILEVFYVVQ
jgi:hypothetical protein